MEGKFYIFVTKNQEFAWWKRDKIAEKDQKNTKIDEKIANFKRERVLVKFTNNPGKIVITCQILCSRHFMSFTFTSVSMYCRENCITIAFFKKFEFKRFTMISVLIFQLFQVNWYTKAYYDLIFFGTSGQFHNVMLYLAQNVKISEV